MLKRTSNISVLLVLLLAWTMLHASPAAPHVEAALQNARLAGQGKFTWFGLRIYDAQLWVGEQGYRPGARFALDLRYARSLQGAKIAAASLDEIKKLGLGSAPQHAAWLQDMTRIFPDVKDGSHITGVFLPDAGARFYLDGKLLGDVADPAFAQAFFAIWLDPKTSAPGLRDALLLDAAPRR
ncbi:MAG: chalcone isomerase family protein [Pseudomonadota bacterium]